MPGVLKALLRHLPAPVIVGALGLGALWLMGRLDGAQSARLAEQDRQDQAAVEQTLRTRDARQRTRDASEQSRREVARLQTLAAGREQQRRAAEAKAASLAGRVDSLLAGLDTATAAPIRGLLAAQRDQITALTALQALTRAEADSNAADRDRWQAQEGQADSLARTWRAQSGRWEKIAKEDGCRRLLGIIPVPDVGAGAAVVWAGSKLAVGPAVTASIRFSCLVPG